MNDSALLLDVLIVAYGADGLLRVAVAAHPRMPGVRYVVSWQRGDAPDDFNIPEALAGRDDFEIFPSESRGIARNRNAAFRHARAPYLLLSDDDLDYTEENLHNVIDSMQAHPECSLIAFRYTSDDAPRDYPDHSFPLDEAPKGYFVTSFEIALNRRRILQLDPEGTLLRMNEAFGIGGVFCAGEEDLLVDELIRAGHATLFIPLDVAAHPGPTTGMRRSADPEFIRCKGTVVGRTHPLSWPLRMILHARRQSDFAPAEYCRLWASGYRDARRRHLFGNSEGKGSLWWLSLLLIASLYAILTAATPMLVDDWVFMGVYNMVNGASPGHDAPLSPEGFFRFWLEIRDYDNGRLANVMAPLTTMSAAGRALFPVLNGAAVAFIIAMMLKMALPKGARRSPFAVALAWGMAIALLPWRDSIFVADYSLNYIWGSSLSLLFISAALPFRNPRCRSGLKFAAALLLAIVAGAWHEGFAFTTLCGFILLSATDLAKGHRYGFRWWCLGVLYAAAAFAVFICPGMMIRVGQQMGDTAHMTDLLKTGADFAGVLLLLCLLILSVFFRSGRRALANAWCKPSMRILLTAVAAGTLLSLTARHQPRSAFWPDLLSIICILSILSGIIRTIVRRRRLRTLRITLALLFIAACTIQTLSVIVWQTRFMRENREIMHRMELSESGTVFADIIPPESLPLYTLKIPAQTAWVTPFHYHSLSEYNGKPFCAVVPPSLRDATLADALPVGDSDSVYTFAGSLILPYHKGDRPSIAFADITFDDGSILEGTYTAVIPFRSEAGDSLLYLRPTGVWRPVREINLSMTGEK